MSDNSYNKAIDIINKKYLDVVDPIVEKCPSCNGSGYWVLSDGVSPKCGKCWGERVIIKKRI